MKWTDRLGGVLLQYAHARPNQLFPDIEDDFARTIERAPKDVIENGLIAAFRDENTRIFPDLVVELFTHSDAQLRAELLMVLLPYISRESKAVLADGGLFDFPFGSLHIRPDRMMEISPEAVSLMANEAEQRHRSGTIEAVSALYASHLADVKGLCAGTLILILTSIAAGACRR